ncbi:hypothetical protein N431DRAFT_472787 [Stipitochalara longipes BDJ]|nr:hypothetical protein N431DRAFT_472787 [Stipitochalara longipes BDJ]
MKTSFSTLISALSLAGFTLADLHQNAFCIDSTDAGDVLNEAATTTACGYYFMRNKGTEQWNTCPDCVMLDTPSIHCNSEAWHIGGDEITYYCKLAKADNALTS